MAPALRGRSIIHKFVKEAARSAQKTTSNVKKFREAGCVNTFYKGEKMRNYRKKRVHLPGVIALCLTLILGSLPSVPVLAAEAGMTESTVIAGESGSENAEQQEENSSVPSEEEQAAPEEEQTPAEEEPVLTELEPAEEQTPAETISDDSETSASESMTSEPAEAVVSMPAVELRKEIEDKGITVIVQAEEGTFPEGTVLEAEWVDDKEILDRITEAAREAALKLKAEQAAAEGQTEQDAEAADSAEESVSADVDGEVTVDAGNTSENPEGSSDADASSEGQDGEDAVKETASGAPDDMAAEGEADSEVSADVNAAGETNSDTTGAADGEAELLFDIMPFKIVFQDAQGQQIVPLKKFILKIESQHVVRENEAIIIQSYKDPFSEEEKWITTALDKKVNEILEESMEEKDTVSFKIDREAYYGVFYLKENQRRSGEKTTAAVRRKAAGTPTAVTGLNGMKVVVSGYCGTDVQWYLHEDGTIWIFGQGAITSSPWKSTGHSGQIKKVLIDDGVTSICDEAFRYISSIESVVIGDGVQKIGRYCFGECRNLQSVELGDGVREIDYEAFGNTSKLSSVTFGKNVKSLSGDCFENAGAGSNVRMIFRCDPSQIMASSFSFNEVLATAYYPLGSGNPQSTTWGSAKSIKWISYSEWDSDQSSPVCATGINDLKVVTSGYCGDSAQWYLHEDGTLWIFGQGAITSSPWKSTGHSGQIKKVLIDDGVTSICDEAFKSISSIESVVIGDGVQKIGRYCFGECRNLQSVELGDGVREINYGAFTNTSKLSSVMFGKNVKSLSNDCFENAGAGSNVRMIFRCDPSQIMASSFSFNEVLATAYYPLGSGNPQSTTWGSAKSIKWISYDSWNEDLLSGFDNAIMLGDQAIVLGQTAKKQIDVYSKDSDASILANAATVSSGDSSILEVVKESGVIMSGETASLIVRLTGKREGTTTLTVDCGSGITRTVNVTVKSAPKVDVNATEEEIKASGLIDISTLLPDSINIDLGKVLGPEISIDRYEPNLFKTDAKFALDFKHVHTAVNIDPDKKNIKVIFGINQDTSTTLNDTNGYVKRGKHEVFMKNWEEFKSLFSDMNGLDHKSGPKLWNKYRSLTSKLEKADASLGIKVDQRVAGFLEFSYASGTLEMTGGGATCLLSAKGSVDAKITPPCYLAFTAELSASSKIALENWNVKEARVFTVEAEPSFEIGIGVGVGDRAVTKTYMEGGLKGALEVPVKFRNGPEGNSLELEMILKGKLYFKASALWIFKYSRDKEIGDGITIFSTKTSTGKRKASAKPVMEVKKSDFEAEPRTGSVTRRAAPARVKALTEGGAFNRNGTFAYTNPQMMTLDSGVKVLFWLEDIAEKADDDRLTIYYSIYDPETDSWEAGQPLFENGAYNGVPAVATDGKRIGVVWQRADRALGTSGDMETLMSCLDLWYTEFDGESFTEPVCVSDAGNGLKKENYTVLMQDGAALVTWTENSENDLFGLAGTNVLYQRTINSEELSPVKTVISTDKSISDVNSYQTENGTEISYRLYDGESSELYAGSGNGETDMVTSGEELAYSQWSGGKLYYLRNNAVCEVQTGTEVPIGISGINNFTIVRNGDNAALLTVVRNGNYSEIYKSVYDAKTGTWGKLVQITDLGGFIRSYDAVLTDEGLVQMTVNLLTVTDNEEEPFGAASIRTIEETGYTDLIVGESASYDVTAVGAGKSVPITVTAKNNSSKELQSFTLKLTNASGKELASQTVTQTMKPGETQDLTMQYTVPAGFTRQVLTVTVSIGEEEVNIENNSAQLEIGQADLVVNELKAEMKNGVAQLSGNVSNNGFETAQNLRISILDKTTGEYVLAETAFADKIGSGEMKEFVYVLPEQYWTLVDDSIRYQLEFQVVSDTEESRLDNNTASVVFKDLHEGDGQEAVYVSMAEKDLYINPGATATLSVSVAPADSTDLSLTWTSSNPSAVKVENGVVTAVGAGEAKVSATTVTGISAFCMVHVREYGEPVFNWSEDMDKCSAVFTSKEDSHKETVDGTIATETVEPTCTAEGTITYTAEAVFNGKTYTGVRTVAIPAKGHTDEDKDLVCDICGERASYRITLTSGMEGDESGTTVAALAGGGIYKVLPDGSTEEASISAPSKVGYDFRGWYLEDGSMFSSSAAYSFIPDQDYALKAVYAPTSDKVTLRVNGGGFTITGSSRIQKSVTKKVTPGTAVTVCYADDTREFLHWVNESGRIVSKNKEYTFTVISASTLEAVSVSPDDYDGEKMAFVEFTSYYDQVLSAETYSTEDSIEFPAGPSRKGYTFTGWDHTEETIHSAIQAGETHITVKPTYEKSGNMVLINVSYLNVEHEVDTYEAPEGELIRLEAPEIPDHQFACWKAADGTMLSTEPVFQIMTVGDADIYAEYVPEGTEGLESLPLIAMTGASASVVDGKNKISFLAVRSVPEGFTVVEHGILRSTDSQYGEADAARTMVIGATNVKKNPSTTLDNNGSYSVNITVGSKTTTKVYARGYLVVQDTEGNQTTVYSENILGYTFEELSQ